MAKIGIGVEFSEKGQGKVLSSLKNIEKGTNRIRQSTFALGGISAGAVLGAFRKLAQGARQLGQDAMKTLEDAKSGEAISSMYSEAGLAQLDGLAKGWQNFKDKIESTIVNALPALVWGIKVVWAEAKYLGEGVAKTVWNFITSFPDTLKTLGNNFKIFFGWLVDNWKEIATAIGKSLVDVFVANFETLKNLITAVKNWVQGEGWNFKVVNPLDQIKKNFSNIKGPEFEQFAFVEKQAAIWADLGKERDAAMVQAWEERQKTEATKISGTEKKKEKTKDTKDLAEAVIRGSVAGVSAINKIRFGESTDVQMLAEARTHTVILKQIANKQTPKEVSI
jgi:hypothetical protein